MEHYFYRTDNLINGKFYYGSGSRENYLGSGVSLNNAIKKYGRENFKINKLKYFKTREEAYNFEDKFLTLYKISNLENSYNMKDCGKGAAFGEKNHMFGKNRTEETKLKMSKAKKGKYKGRQPMLGKKHTEETKLKMSLSRKGSGGSMYGKNHTEESKLKMKKSKQGCKNEHSLDKNIYEFIHNEFGYYKCTFNTLRTKFNLNRSNLRNVIRGKYKSCKGWTLYKKI
jgi:group I intron endonuclease